MTDETEICGSADTESGEPCQTPAHLCQWHSGGPTPDGGRPSKFDDVEDDLVEAAKSFLNHEQVANKAGVHKDTLYRYLNNRPDFSDSFKRARAEAAEQLIQQALDPEDEIDMGFARFLLERSFKFIKTERREHAGKIDGFEVVIGGDGPGSD